MEFEVDITPCSAHGASDCELLGAFDFELCDLT